MPAPSSPLLCSSLACVTPFLPRDSFITESSSSSSPSHQRRPLHQRHSLSLFLLTLTSVERLILLSSPSLSRCALRLSSRAALVVPFTRASLIHGDYARKLEIPDATFRETQHQRQPPLLLLLLLQPFCSLLFQFASPSVSRLMSGRQSRQ